MKRNELESQPFCDQKVNVASCRDCRFCYEGKGKQPAAKREKPLSWQLRKGKGGWKIKVVTEGYISEGNLRASHRALSQAPYENLGLPFYSYD